MAIHVQRRKFIVSLSCMAAWPLAARAQQTDRMRRIGLLMNRAADNPEGQDRIAAFHQGLQELGWSVGRNVRIDTVRTLPGLPSLPSRPGELPSRPGELHPEPLTDPDLTLSRHPARATARRLPPSS